KIFSPLASRHFRPDIFVSASGRFYREINILFISGTDLSQFLFCRRIDRIEIIGRLRRDEPAIDEKLIAVAQFNVIARLRRRRVTPTLAEIQTSFCDRASVDLAISNDDRQLRDAWFPSRHKARARKNNLRSGSWRRPLLPIALGRRSGGCWRQSGKERA